METYFTSDPSEFSLQPLQRIGKAACFLAVSEGYVHGHIQAGELPQLRFGRMIRIRLSDLDELVDRHLYAREQDSPKRNSVSSSGQNDSVENDRNFSSGSHSKGEE